VLNRVHIKKQRGGLRTVNAVLDGVRVPEFTVYPQAIEKYPDERGFLAYVERQARAILELDRDARLRKNQAA
jgi:hypothetical protein